MSILKYLRNFRKSISSRVFSLIAHMNEILGSVENNDFQKYIFVDPSNFQLSDENQPFSMIDIVCSDKYSIELINKVDAV